MPARRDLAHDIALGHDADDFAVSPVDDNATNAMLPSSLAISSSDVSGAAVNTPLPFMLENCGDVHARFLQPGSFVPVACDILSLTGQVCK